MTETVARTRLQPGSPAQQGVAGAVDRWDATAHLESAGYSATVAKRAGYPTTFTLASELFKPRGLRSKPRRGRMPELLAAVARSIIMLAGVLICVSTIPPQTAETDVFIVAAVAWLAGQIVSAATWHGWGHGHRGDAAAGGMAAVALMVLVGIAVSFALGDPTALIWVMWTASLPVLTILSPGRILTGVAIAVAAAAVLVREQFGYAPAVSLAIVTTAAALVTAYLLTRRIRRALPGKIQAGHLQTVSLAAIQTVGQLTALLAIVWLIQPGAFGGVAVAGLLAGLVADPVFEFSRILSGQIAGRTSRWRIGAAVIGAIAAVVVVLIVITSVAVTWWYLADPYSVYPNMPLVLAAGGLIGGLTAGISVQLRSGRALGAMSLAIATAAMVAIAALVSKWDYNLADQAFLITGAIVAVLSTVIASRCLTHPNSW